MTTLDVDVADVETVARAARSADTRAAIAYLIASGATAISVIENETGCTYRVGTRIDPRAASVHWLPEAKAKPVLKAARKHAGKSPDIATAISALHQAAADLKVTLTEHGTAMMRAGEAAAKLDAFIASLRARGAMKEFTRTYKRRRLGPGCVVKASVVPDRRAAAPQGARPVATGRRQRADGDAARGRFRKLTGDVPRQAVGRFALIPPMGIQKLIGS
jgi:hypothetical protein